MANRELAEGLAAFLGTYISEKKDRRRENEDLRRWQFHYDLQRKNAELNQQSAMLQRARFLAELQEQSAKARQSAEARAALSQMFPNVPPEVLADPDVMRMADSLIDNKRADDQFAWRQDVDERRLGLEQDRVNISRSRASSTNKEEEEKLPKVPTIAQSLYQKDPQAALLYQIAQNERDRTEERLRRHAQDKRVYFDEYGDPQAGLEAEAQAWADGYRKLQRSLDAANDAVSGFESSLLPEQGGQGSKPLADPGKKPGYIYEAPDSGGQLRVQPDPSTMRRGTASNPVADFFGGMVDTVGGAWNRHVLGIPERGTPGSVWLEQMDEAERRRRAGEQ